MGGTRKKKQKTGGRGRGGEKKSDCLRVRVRGSMNYTKSVARPGLNVVRVAAVHVALVSLLLPLFWLLLLLLLLLLFPIADYR